MDRKSFIALMAFAGLLTGFAAIKFVGSDNGYCGTVEDQIRTQQNFSGTVACYPPGVIEVNLSEEIKNKTELRCVCRKVKDDEVQLFPITVSR